MLLQQVAKALLSDFQATTEQLQSTYSRSQLDDTDDSKVTQFDWQEAVLKHRTLALLVQLQSFVFVNTSDK